MTEKPTLEVRDLKKYYKQGDILTRLLGQQNSIKAVDGVNLTIWPGETYGLVGESGSGKSTLGETILRLRESTAGEIYINGENITDIPDTSMRKLRKSAQIIFQDPYSSLNPRKTVFQSLAEPVRNFEDLDDEELEDRITSTLSDVGLRPPTDFLSTYPSQLSGGQQQRVNIARALILEPDILVADEPMSMLDVSLQAGIIDLLDRLRTKYNFALLFITHDLSLVNLLADRVGVMYRGKLVEQGDTKAIMHDPKHPYTQALISSLPDVRQERERVILPGDSSDETNFPAGCRFHPRCPDEMDVCSQAIPALVEAESREVACFLHHDKISPE